MDQGSACQEQEQQVSAQRQTEAGPSSQQEARLEVLPAQDWALPHRPGGASTTSSTEPRPANTFKNCPHWKGQQKALWTTVLEETRKHPGPARIRDRTKIAELFAGERCSQAVLDFLATTDVGKTAGPPVASGRRSGQARLRVENSGARGTSHRWQRKRPGGGAFSSFVKASQGG